MSEILSRREFFVRAGIVGLSAAAVGSSISLFGCKKKGSEGPDCTDLSGVPEAEVTMRNSLQYRDVSDQEGKHCENCNLFQAPAESGQCGTCTLNLGPVSPQGYCNSWVEKVAAG